MQCWAMTGVRTCHRYCFISSTRYGLGIAFIRLAFNVTKSGRAHFFAFCDTLSVKKVVNEFLVFTLGSCTRPSPSSSTRTTLRHIHERSTQILGVHLFATIGPHFSSQYSS
eukprot:g37701.t1